MTPLSIAFSIDSIAFSIDSISISITCLWFVILIPSSTPGVVGGIGTMNIIT